MFHASPGLFHFSQVDLTEDTCGHSAGIGVELAALRVIAQRTSLESSSLSPVSGVIRSEERKGLVLVTLSDGSLHAVRDGCTAPTLIDTDSGHAEDSLDSESTKLTQLLRKVFAKTENERLTTADVGKIHGSTNFDGFGTLLWMQEYGLKLLLLLPMILMGPIRRRCRPSDFNFVPDAKRSQTVIVARLMALGSTETMFLRYLQQIIDHPS